jgi:hypothetical protein
MFKYLLNLCVLSLFMMANIVSTSTAAIKLFLVAPFTASYALPEATATKVPIGALRGMYDRWKSSSANVLAMATPDEIGWAAQA